MERPAAKERSLAGALLAAVVALLLAAPSLASLTTPATTTGASAHTTALAPGQPASYAETRYRASTNLEQPRDRIEATLSRFSCPGYGESSGWEVAGSLDAPKSGVPSAPGQALLPGEGTAGAFDDLVRMGRRGDNLTPHHLPSNEYMLHAEVPGYTRGKGVSMMMEQPTPGIGGRHRATWSYGRSPDMTLSPRQALGREVWDVRSIYQRQGLLTAEIRRALLDVIRRNKAAWSVFRKP